ncbi:exopolysaccharide biosynthesis polyprenyl glycosylphosphotransferase [Asticcacaulis sp. DW145]|uniref:sugar transferase n=1 Tax=Asticcacaulis sp. DW145 TaxID=3095608 RepID=UPI00308A840B|nr:exopolysaccharide biosynthesis polyprenyl glycosylphosphotransferase [Asticcacaulis sp. DW145]
MRNIDAYSSGAYQSGPIGSRVTPSGSRVGKSLSKSVFDFLIAGFALAFLLPALALIAIFIKCDSKGPVLFRQTRTGLNGRKFFIYKFRTMHVLEDGACVRQAVAGDARITRLGYWLRRSSLDELPQLINVLKGEMSLVGPRPHAVVHDELFSEVVEGYYARTYARPGLTGLAQIRGYRGEVKTHYDVISRVKSDIEYIENWSWILDIKIILSTTMVFMLPNYKNEKI